MEHKDIESTLEDIRTTLVIILSFQVFLTAIVLVIINNLIIKS